MRFNPFVLAAVMSLGLDAVAQATTATTRCAQQPASLLLFPEFDNRIANLTLVTVTNTNADSLTGTVKVEFVYIGKYRYPHTVIDCLEFNRTHTLTANDTLSVITSAHSPQQEEGYLYVFAKDVNTGAAKVFNHLIGNEMTLLGLEALDYSLNPVAFKGIGDGTITDLDGDGNRDLDGNEYEQVPEEILVPRFLGQYSLPPEGGGISATFHSELILIGLSGGAAFTTIANFWIYNDNEEAFSAQYTFTCWDRINLAFISGAFTETFLDSTNNAAGEVVGYTSHESGWFRVYGGTAFSSAEQIQDPAIYAVLIEKVGPHAAADLPFESEELQDNGALLPRGIFGDGDPIPVNGDNK